MATTTPRSDGLALSGEVVRGWARVPTRVPLVLVGGFVVAIVSLGLTLGSLPAMLGLATVLTLGIGLMMAMKRELTIQHALLLGSTHFTGALLLV